jgi:hypothetical protein
MYKVNVTAFTKYGHNIKVSLTMTSEDFFNFEKNLHEAMSKLSKDSNIPITFNYLNGIITGIIGIEYSYWK